MTVNAINSPITGDDWASGADFIGGADLRDKAELVGQEMLITGVRFESNARGVNYAYITATTRAGETFEFNDSSTTGIRGQLISYLTGKDAKFTPDANTGELHAVKILVPRGLRVSSYEVTDARGKAKTAKTYYLTSGTAA